MPRPPALTSGDVWPNDHDQYDLADVAASPNARIPVRPVADLAPARRVDRGARVLLVALGLLSAVLLSAGAPADARPAQDPGTSTTAGFPVASSTTPVSVTTAAPTTATAGVTTSAPASTAGPGSTRVADENRKIWVVVGALVAVALALTLLTIRYWRQTRPRPVPLGMPTGDLPPAPAIRGGRLEHDEGAVADASSVSDSSSAPAVEAWAPTAGATDDADAGSPTEALPVVVVGAAVAAATGPDDQPAATDAAEAEPATSDDDVARTSRRAVAGADHAGADEGWEPHSTGQHERVVIAPTERRARPTAAQRAAAFSVKES